MESKFQLDFANTGDVDSWMDLVYLVKNNFPGLDIDEYKKNLIENIISKRTALCVRLENDVVGVLLFSFRTNSLSCMAVHPQYRKKGIGSALVKKMIDLMPKDSDIWVSTFRENDPMGIAPRAFYKKFGFIEDELLIGYGDYPCQKFVLRR